MRSMYLWQANQMAERTLDQIAATLALGNVDEIRYKAGQFTTWTGHFDHGGAWSINSLADVASVRDGFQAHGIRSYPWVVPMGLDAEAEAQFAAGIALVCGRLDLDVEPGSDFWGAVNQHDYRAVVPYFSRLRQLVGPDVELTLDFPGKWAWGYLTPLLKLAEPYVDRFAIQSYFGVPDARNDQALLRQITQKPIDQISSVGWLASMLAWLQTPGAAACGFVVWQASEMNAAAYELLAAASFPDAPPVPTPLYAWQPPGFSALRQSHPEMADPSGNPYSDGQGNVWQEAASGRALWIREYNANYWLPKQGAA
jgi:hypothetical protein